MISVIGFWGDLRASKSVTIVSECKVATYCRYGTLAALALLDAGSPLPDAG